MPDQSADLIVLVHGFGGKRIAMEPLRWRLQKHGFRVNSWSYPSLTSSVDRHGRNFHTYLTESLQHEQRIHLVAHSMGSIVTRFALSLGSIVNLGRAVFFAPPNRGTPVARYAAHLAGRLCPPVIDLSDTDTSTVNCLPTAAGIEIGILAARFDILVPIANTHLANQRDHHVLNATHNSMLWSTEAARLAASFLRTGRFR